MTARGADALEELAARDPAIDPPRRATSPTPRRWPAWPPRWPSATARIDIALLNAGTYRPVLPETFTAELFRPHVEVNIMGTVNCIEAVLPDMLAAASGRIAVVASVTGFAALPMAAAYGATKAFLISMCESLRADLHGERRGST